jgi:hypothetical protein
MTLVEALFLCRSKCRNDTPVFTALDCFSLKNAQKWLSNLQWMTCLEITGGIHSTPTSVLEVDVATFYS